MAVPTQTTAPHLRRDRAVNRGPPAAGDGLSEAQLQGQQPSLQEPVGILRIAASTCEQDERAERTSSEQGGLGVRACATSLLSGQPR